VSIGDTLAEARRQAGLTITQVSQRTRIRESIIRGIEQGDFSACGGSFYARGHIRSIASAVGIDPVPLIMEYDTENGPPGGISAADVFEPSTPIKLHERRRSPSLGLIVAIVLLAIIGYSVYHLTLHGGKNTPAAASTLRATPSATAMRTTPRASTSPTISPVATDAVIVVSAKEECWVELTNAATGLPIFEGDLYPGSPASWTEKQDVHLTLGNPRGVVLTVNGHVISTNSVQVLTLNISPTTS
jgi:transcriptional regulator with XRE-family HTH domain